MCGIVGYFSNNPVRHCRALWESARKHQYRGPDETTHYDHDGFAVVFNRLAIVSQENGSQPLSDGNGAVISFANAEIYNHINLKNRYPEYFYQNDSDCAVIPTLYHYFGEQFVDQLEGMFSIVIYDRPRSQILLIRDPLGIKPLFYSVDQQGDFFFSSEAKGVLPFFSEKNIDFAEMLDDPWLRGDVGYNALKYRNTFAGIKSVPPGSMVKYNMSTGGIEIVRYFSGAPENMPPLTTPSCYIAAFSKAFHNSCRQQLSSSGRQAFCSAGGLTPSVFWPASGKQTWLPIH